MRRIGIAMWVLMAALSVPMGAMAATAPKIDFPQSQKTFTPVVEGQAVTQNFVVRNSGDADLEIYKVRTG